MEYELKISADHLRAIGQALQELPYRVASPIIAALDPQIKAQDAARQAKPE